MKDLRTVSALPLTLGLLAILLAPPATARGRGSSGGGKAWLGVLLGQDAKPGIPIKRVLPGSPAQKAGMKKGDRVLRVAGGGVPSVKAMQQAVAAHRPGQTVTLRIRRSGAVKTLKVRLERMPSYEERVKRHLLGKKAPGFSATRVGSAARGKVSARGLRGKVVLLEFWASWCGACRRAVPMLKAIHNQYARHGLRIVAIAKDPVSRIGPLADRLGIPYTVGADPRGQAMRAYWINPIPAFVLLDQAGVVRALAVGAGWSQDFKDLLRKAHDLLMNKGPRRRASPRRRVAPRRASAGRSRR
jgi:thiol-disulfide isomerase/thioredoxin